MSNLHFPIGDKTAIGAAKHHLLIRAFIIRHEKTHPRN